MPMYDIYVFKGDDRFFLYPRCSNDSNRENENIIKILIECKCLYRLENKTLEFCEKIECVPHTQIDGMVIFWMSKEGIDHVRGGSFADPVLSDSTKEYISKQIKYMNYDLEKNDMYIKKLQDPIDISFSLLPQQIEKCKNTQCKIEKYYPVVSIENLEWLRNMIDTSLSGTWKFAQIIDKYNALMKQMATLYKQYKDFTVDADVQWVEDVPYLSSPHIYFDARVIPEERARYTRDDKDAEVFKTYELMIYTLINRTDEMKFDIQDFDIEWEEFRYNYCKQLLALQ